MRATKHIDRAISAGYTVSRWRAWRARRALYKLTDGALRDDLGSVKGLAHAASTGWALQEYAVNALLVLAFDDPTSTALRNGVCAEWASSRSKTLARVISATGLRPLPNHAVATLVHLRFDEVSPLRNSERFQSVLQLVDDDEPVVRENAKVSIGETPVEAIWLALESIWTASRSPLAERVLLDHRRPAVGPDEVRIPIALLTDDPWVRSIGPERLSIVVAALNDDRLGESARVALAELTSRDAQAAMCVRALEGDAILTQICVDAEYLPHGDEERAVFLFLTEQFERYEGLDFDGRLLAGAYEALGAEMQTRIRTTATRAGRASALRVVLGGDRVSRIRTISETESAFLIEQTAAAGDYDELWKLCMELSITSVLAAVRRLRESGFAPPHVGDRRLFEELAAAAASGLESRISGLESDLPVALKRATAVFNGRINGLAFSRSRPHLAIGSNARAVGVWDLQAARMVKRTLGFRRSVGHVVMMDDDSVVAAERTNSPRNECGVYLWSDRLTRIGSHRGSVTGVLVSGESQVVSAGRDSKVMIWNLRSLSAAGSIRLSSWPRSIKRVGSRVVATGTALQIVDLAAQSASTPQWLGTSRVPAAVGVAPGDQEFVVGYGNGSVVAVAAVGYRAQPLQGTNAGRVTSIETVPQRDLVFVGSQDGAAVYSWPSRRQIGRVGADKVTSITVSPGGEFVALGHTEDQATLWDLRVASIPRLFNEPLIDTTPSELAILEAATESGHLRGSSAVLVQLMRSVLRHRFRHDIELSELVTIRAGRHDIAIDDSRRRL